METYDPHKSTTEVRGANRRTTNFRVLIIGVVAIVILFAADLLHLRHGFGRTEHHLVTTTMARLKIVTRDDLTIVRRRSGKGFSYLDTAGQADRRRRDASRGRAISAFRPRGPRSTSPSIRGRTSSAAAPTMPGACSTSTTRTGR